MDNLLKFGLPYIWQQTRDRAYSVNEGAPRGQLAPSLSAELSLLMNNGSVLFQGG